MILNVLGSCGGYPCVGGACSGYLLESGKERIILDLGSGSLANLRAVCDLPALTGVICSHLHFDHISDLFVLNYALELSGLQPIPVYAPAEPEAVFNLLSACKYLDVRLITEDLKLTMGDCTVTFREMQHGVKDFAVKIDDGQKVFMYTGDTCLCDALKDFVQGVHTLLCDCTFIEDIHSDKHLSLPEAVEVANHAKVRHLIMTHFDPNLRPQKYYQYANDRFNGRVSKAEVLAKIRI